MTTQHAQLSEWWQTPSAQAAIERAKAKQREKILELRRRIAQWYERVNAAWPNPRPPLTAEEAIRAAKRLYRFSRGRKWVGPVKITSGRRYTWIQYGTM